jgi:hypothetical protein
MTQITDLERFIRSQQDRNPRDIANDAKASAGLANLDGWVLAGRYLLSLQRLIGWGTWGDTLRDYGIHPKAAERYMQIASQEKMVRAARAASLRQAIAAVTPGPARGGNEFPTTRRANKLIRDLTTIVQAGDPKGEAAWVITYLRDAIKEFTA